MLKHKDRNQTRPRRSVYDLSSFLETLQTFSIYPQVHAPFVSYCGCNCLLGDDLFIICMVSRLLDWPHFESPNRLWRNFPTIVICFSFCTVWCDNWLVLQHVCCLKVFGVIRRMPALSWTCHKSNMPAVFWHTCWFLNCFSVKSEQINEWSLLQCVRGEQIQHRRASHV